MIHIYFPFLVLMFIAAGAPVTVFDADQDAIRSVWDTSVEAALEGNYDGYVAHFSEDIEVVQPDASLRLLGLEDIESVYRPAIEGRAYTGIYTKRFNVQVAPSGNFAWGTAEAEIAVGDDMSTMWFGLVYRKEAGDWKLLMAHDAEAK